MFSQHETASAGQNVKSSYSFPQAAIETVLICTKPVKESVVCTRSIQMMAILSMFTATRKQPVEGGQ